jgi:hypothetical protein
MTDSKAELDFLENILEQNYQKRVQHTGAASVIDFLVMIQSATDKASRLLTVER